MQEDRDASLALPWTKIDGMEESNSLDNGFLHLYLGYLCASLFHPTLS